MFRFKTSRGLLHRAFHAFGHTLCIVAASSLSLSPFATIMVVTAPGIALAQEACDVAGSWKTTRGPMRIALNEANISGLITAPNGLESVRGTPDGAAFAITLVNAAGKTLMGRIAASADCTTLTGEIGTAFTSKRLAGASPEEIIDPAAIAEAHQSLTVTEALLADIIAHVDLSPNDPAKVLEATGNDPEALGQWVAGNTILLAYEGALRSPEQVLADRHGNSLDRARLLAFLLEQAGFSARLAHGELDADALTALYDIDRRELPPRPVLFTGYDLGTLAERVPGADVEQIAADAEALKAATPAQEESASLRILDSLLPLLRPATATVPPLSTQYWWVEYDRGGVWTALALDPVAGLPAPVEVLTPGELPEELFHRLTIKVAGETEDADGKLVESEVYTGTIFAQDAASGELRLSFIPGGVPLGLTASEAILQADSTLAALAAESAWVPILNIDDEVSAKNVLIMDGRSLTPDEAYKEGFGRQLFGDGGAGDLLTDTGGILGDFGDILNGGDTTAPEVEDRLTAVYIDYVIEVPGVPVRTERRTLWDRFGAERRAAGDLAIEPLSPEAVLARVDAFADTRHIVVQTIFEREESVFKRIAVSLSENLAQFEAPLMAYAEGTVPDDLGDGNSGALAPLFFELERRTQMSLSFMTAMQRPDIVTYIERPALAERGGFPGPDLRIDIVQSGLMPYWFDFNVFDLRVFEGIGATVAEAEVTDRGVPVQNAARAYLKSLDEGIAWSVYRSLADLEEKPVPVEIAGLVAMELARGNIVVAPTEAIPLDETPWSGYWRINPQTGETLGVDPRGGATFNEYLTKIHAVLTSAIELKKWTGVLNFAMRATSLLFCATSYYYSDRGKVAKAILILCIAGEALNFANNARSLQKFFAERFLKQYETPVRSLLQLESAEARRAFVAGVGRYASYAGDIGKSLDEIYAFAASLGNALKFFSGGLGVLNNAFG